jgi:hypothetical protein
MFRLKYLPTLIVFLILVAELVLAFVLRLPLGWPRFLVAFVVLATAVLLYVVTHKAAKEKLL